MTTEKQPEFSNVTGPGQQGYTLNLKNEKVLSPGSAWNGEGVAPDFARADGGYKDVNSPEARAAREHRSRDVNLVPQGDTAAPADGTPADPAPAPSPFVTGAPK